MSDLPKFTIEQKKYLKDNLKHLNLVSVDRFIEYLPEKIKSDEQILREFIHTEKERISIGSGDDGLYTQELEEYILKQKELWLYFINYLREELK